MKKIKIHQVILQDDGRIQLTCDCCRRPSAFDLKDSVNYLSNSNETEWKWACQFDDCRRSESEFKRIGYQITFEYNTLTKDQVQQILRFRKDD